MIDELRLQGALSEWKARAGGNGSPAKILVWGDQKAPPSMSGVPAWSWTEAKNGKKPVTFLSGKSGPAWLVRPALLAAEEAEGALGWLNYSAYAQGRDSVGQALVQA